MPRYPVLSPVRVNGKTVKPKDGTAVTVTLDEDDGAELVALGALGEAKAESASRKTSTKKTSTKKAPTKSDDDPVADAFGAQVAAALAEAGLSDLGAVLAKTDDELRAIDGVGDATIATVTTLREEKAA